MSVQEWCEQRETSLMSGPNAGSSPENGEQNATRSPAATAAWGGASGSKADGRSRVLHKWQWQPEEGGEGVSQSRSAAALWDARDFLLSNLII